MLIEVITIEVGDSSCIGLVLYNAGNIDATLYKLLFRGFLDMGSVEWTSWARSVPLIVFFISGHELLWFYLSW